MPATYPSPKNSDTTLTAAKCIFSSCRIPVGCEHIVLLGLVRVDRSRLTGHLFQVDAPAIWNEHAYSAGPLLSQKGIPKRDMAKRHFLRPIRANFQLSETSP